MITNAYKKFTTILTELRRALETTKGRARDDEEIRVVGYRIFEDEGMELGSMWRSEFLVIANTNDDVETTMYILKTFDEVENELVEQGVVMFIMNITSLDDVTATKRKSIAIEISALWQD